MSKGAAPPGPLLALTAAVLAAHALVLRPAPASVQAPAPAKGKPFVVRTVAVAAPAPAPVATPVALSAAPAKPVAPMPARPRPRTAVPLEAPTRVDTAAAAVQPAPAISVAAAAPEAAPAAPPRTLAVPGSVRLHYKVDLQARGLALQGAGELAWRHDGESYEAKLEFRAPFGSPRTQRSTGRLTPEGLAPLRFSEKGRSEEAAHFERDKGKVSFSSNRPDVPLLPGAQDRLSVFLQLGAMIAGEPAKFPPGTAVTLQTAGTRDAEPWVFMVEGEEQLVLPGGNVGALKLTRSPRKEFDTKVELWLAPGMAYVPVRLRLTQPNGDSLDQQWSSTDRG
jgi:hypothetical protein